MPVIIGLGVGAAANMISQGDKFKHDRTTAAYTARYSPWTKLTPEMPKADSPLGDAVQGGMQGAAFGQGVDNAMTKQALSRQLLGGAQAVGVGAQMAKQSQPTPAQQAPMPGSQDQKGGLTGMDYSKDIFDNNDYFLKYGYPNPGSEPSPRGGSPYAQAGPTSQSDLQLSSRDPFGHPYPGFYGGTDWGTYEPGKPWPNVPWNGGGSAWGGLNAGGY